MNSNYTKYKTWAKEASLIAGLLLLLIFIVGALCKQTEWARAVVINYGETNMIYFAQKKDYQQWKRGNYNYIECIHNNELFRLPIDQKTTKAQKKVLNNTVFVLIDQLHLKMLTTNAEISVYTGNTPWLFYFIKNLI